MLQFIWENIWQLNIWVGIEYILPTLGGWMWVGEFLCALRAQGWVIYIFWNIQWYNSIAYMLPTIWGIYVSWIYSLVLIYRANTWGMNVCWRVSVRPLGAGWGNIYFEKYILVEYIFWEIYISWIYMLVLDISCQHLGDEYKLGVSVRPSGAGLENVHFWNIYQLNIYVGIGYIMPTLGRWKTHR